MAVAAAVIVVCLSVLFLPPHRCEVAAPSSPAVQTVELDSSGSTASATSECGTDLVDVNGSPIPTEFCTSSSRCSTCRPGNHSPAAAIDGDPATSWQSSPLSAGEQFRTVNFTLSLGQKFHVTELIVQSGSSPLPASGVLHRSLDGEAFAPLGYFFANPSECPHFIPPGMGAVVPVVGPDGTFCIPAPDANVSVVPLGDLLDIDLSPQSSTLATHLRLELLAARAREDPTDPRQLFYSLSEFSVFGVCPEPIQPEDCAAPDVIRQVRTSLPLQPDIQLLWQQLDNDPTAPPFFGAWHLDNIEIALSPGSCPGVGCVSEDFSGNTSMGGSYGNGGSSTSAQQLPDSVLGVVEGGVVQAPPCGVPESGRGLYFNGPGERHALSVPVEGSDLQFDLGFSAPPPFCLGDLDVPAVELRLCLPGDGPGDVCLLLAIIAPGDCGYCLDQLSTRLQVLRELINATLSSSVVIAIDGTLIAGVREDVLQAQADVQHYEGTLLVLEVVFGIRSFIPPSFLLPPSVVRLDQELVPSILEKLDSLRDLVSRTQEFRIDSSFLLSLLLSLEETLREASSNASRLSNETAAISARIQALLELVRAGLNETIAVRIQVEGIVEIILSRQYEEITREVETVSAEANASLSLSERLLLLAEMNSRLVEEIEDGFDSVEPELMRVLMVAEEVILESQRAQNSSAIATALLDEIERLLALAESLNASSALEVELIRTVVENIESLFLETQLLTRNATLYLDILRILVLELSADVERYRDQLSPYRIPEGCIAPCTEGEMHAAELDFNRTRMVNDSFYTLRFAEEFLENLIDGRPFFAITRIALLAQNLSTEALNQLSEVDSSGLLAEAQEVLPRAVLLGGVAEEVQSRAEVASSRANATLERFQDLYSIFRELEREARNVTAVTESLQDLTGLEDEALEVGAAARNASSVIGAAVARVQRVDEGVGPLRDIIVGAAENIDVANAALDQAESQFDSIQDFLNATREISDRINITVEQFINENNQIISEIDALINSLAGIHDAINKINAPARLAEDDDSISYISLQSPPGRQIDDFIQFETLDLYLWPNADYQVPALIFYAGPVYYDITNTTAPEDYFWVSAEPGGIQLQWQLGSESGQLNVPNQRIDDNSQIFVTRVGSKFELRFGFQVGGLMPGPSSAQVDNSSLLFRTSERTAFLLGGWPEGAELGCPTSPIALSEYFPFRGQFQLFLFNGQQWGLWNIRGTSRPDFIGNGREFRRGSLGAVNIWFDPGLRPSSTSLSLDGLGYIKPRRLANIGSDYSAGTLRDMTIFIRPNNDRDALVMYAYDTMLDLSMEVALQRSMLRLIIRGHRPGEAEPMVDFTDTLNSALRDARLDLIFAAPTGQFEISSRLFSPPAGRFFEDLRRESLQVWFGGVREDMLEAPFVPEITNSSYYGCIDMNIFRPTFMDVFGGTGDFFLTNYVATPLQKGFSASCLSTIYARDVSLDGDGFLSYRFLQLESKPNDVFEAATSLTTLSFTFLPLESSGVILAGLDGPSRLYVVMRGGFLEVGLIGQDQDVVLMSQGEVPLGEQHYLLINLRFTPPDNSVGDHSFYLNGVLQDRVLSFTGFTFRVRTSLGPGPTPQPVLFVGGISEGVIAEIDDVPSFRGCLRDFSYNFGAMSFLNPALLERHPPGITYHTCTFLNVSRSPLLAVRPRPVELRTCLAPPPVDLENTHGGFHKHTHLFTSNVLGLLQRVWNFTMMVKFSEDGHVTSVGSQFGHSITLSIAAGQVILTLTGPEGEQEEVASQQQIGEETFALVAISCDVLENGGQLLSCFLEVDGVLAGNGSLQLPYSSSSGSFVPSLPLMFGQVTGRNGSLVDSFIGCIKGLAINGISAGFIDVQTHVPCYNNTEPGFGFTGISILAQPIPPPPPTVENSILLTFTPLRANGLLLLLTSNATPIFAVGLVNGEVQVSTFNETAATPIAVSIPGNVCSNAAQLLLLSYSANSVELTVAGSGPVNFDIPPSIAPVGELQLTIGGTPADFVVRDGSGVFEFLLSEEVDPDSPPPGFAGCVRDLSINGLPLDISDDSVEYKDLLIGFCPASG